MSCQWLPLTRFVGLTDLLLTFIFALGTFNLEALWIWVFHASLTCQINFQIIFSGDDCERWEWPHADVCQTMETDEGKVVGMLEVAYLGHPSPVMNWYSRRRSFFSDMFEIDNTLDRQTINIRIHWPSIKDCEDKWCYERISGVT